MRINVKDSTKPNYIILINNPQGEPLKMSATFTNLQNAKAEVERRRKYHDEHPSMYEGFSNFYLAEITTNIKELKINYITKRTNNMKYSITITTKEDIGEEVVYENEYDYPDDMDKEDVVNDILYQSLITH